MFAKLQQKKSTSCRKLVQDFRQSTVTNDYIFKRQKCIFESLKLAIESTFDKDKFSKAKRSKIDRL